jgi:phosphate transport system permease protein
LVAGLPEIVRDRQNRPIGARHVTTLASEESPAQQAVPRVLASTHTGVDRIFAYAARSTGATVLLITGGIGLFLALQSVPTLKHYGWSFFTETQWQPESDVLGIGAVLVGTFSVALVALVVAFPLSLATALYISEYAPARLKPTLVSLVDLMAAVPSIVYGLWGFFLLQPHASEVALFLQRHFGWIPVFRVDADPNAAVWDRSRYTASAFCAGLAVAMMVLPMACTVMRQVFRHRRRLDRRRAVLQPRPAVRARREHGGADLHRAPLTAIFGCGAPCRVGKVTG